MSGINLWIRANMEQFCPDTEALLPDHRHEEYRGIVGELLTAGSLLNEAISNPTARTRYEAAQAARYKFFGDMIDEAGNG